MVSAHSSGGIVREVRGELADVGERGERVLVNMVLVLAGRIHKATADGRGNKHRRCDIFVETTRQQIFKPRGSGITRTRSPKRPPRRG